MSHKYLAEMVREVTTMLPTLSKTIWILLHADFGLRKNIKQPPLLSALHLTWKAAPAPCAFT